MFERYCSASDCMQRVMQKGVEVHDRCSEEKMRECVKKRRREVEKSNDERIPFLPRRRGKQ
jgi:hypothetical protein